MQNQMTLKETLGINQEQMSMILKITRTQWSMYVIGKRSLPLHATVKLAEILEFINQPDSNFQEQLQNNSINASKRQKFLEKQKTDNLYKQIILENKLKATQKKYNAALKALKVVRFLETKTQETNQDHELFLEVLKIDFEKIIQKNSLELQEQLQLQYEIVQHEKLLINKKMKKQ